MKHLKGIVLGILAFSPLVAVSEQTEEVASLSTGGMVWQMTLALLVVLSSIFALAWLAKRLNHVGVRGQKDMQLISAMSLGSKEKIILVEVNGEQVLLGVTHNSINYLRHYDAKTVVENLEISESQQNESPQESPLSKMDFSSYLKRILNDKSGA